MRQILASAVLLGLSSSGIAAAADTAPTRQHADWETRTLHSEIGPRFRASANFRAEADQVVLNLDRVAGDCQPVYLSMNVHLEEPAERTYQVAERFGQLRADEGVIHDFDFTVDFYEGERWAIATLRRMSDAGQFIPGLLDARTLRVRMVTPEGEIYLRYSLNGVAAALDDSLARCQAHVPAAPAPAATVSDDRFFGGDDDRGYFQRRSE